MSQKLPPSTTDPDKGILAIVGLIVAAALAIVLITVAVMMFRPEPASATERDRTPSCSLMPSFPTQQVIRLTNTSPWPLPVGVYQDINWPHAADRIVHTVLDPGEFVEVDNPHLDMAVDWPANLLPFLADPDYTLRDYANLTDPGPWCRLPVTTTTQSETTTTTAQETTTTTEATTTTTEATTTTTAPTTTSTEAPTTTTVDSTTSTVADSTTSSSQPEQPAESSTTVAYLVGGGGVQSEQRSSLASTGAPLLVLAGIGLSLAGAGHLLTRFSRRNG